MTKQPSFAEVTESEIAFLVQALSKVKNPKHRYFLTIVVDLLADTLSERSDLSVPELLELGRAVAR